MWATNTVDCYSALKRSEAPTHGPPGMNLENVDTKGHMLYDPIHVKCPQQANPWKQKVGLPGAAGRGMGSDCSWAQGFFLGGQKCSKLVNTVKTTELYALKG